MKMHLSSFLLLGALLGSPAFGALSLSQTDSDPASSLFVDDGLVGSGEYAAVYGNGGGSGFGGTVGASLLYMDSDGTNLYIGWDPGSALNDNAVLLLDTRAGGFTDADMSDTGDPGRNLSSNLTRDVNDVMPVLPDFSVVFGGFGTVSFELNAGSAPNHLNFVAFENDQTGTSDSLVREFTLPLATLGNPTTIDFFMAYGSDTNFMSNESLPGGSVNAGLNPGFDNADNGGGDVIWENYNQFVIPEPSASLLGTFAGLFLLRRRR